MALRIKLQVSGNVQGVGFRYYTLRMARRLCLTGYVKNKPDGSVEVVAEGDRGKLLNLLEDIRIGPPSSKVENIVIKWEDPKSEFADFKVLR